MICYAPVENVDPGVIAATGRRLDKRFYPWDRKLLRGRLDRPGCQILYLFRYNKYMRPQKET
jgi:hypothetical protein